MIHTHERTGSTLERISIEQATALYERASLHELGQQADAACRALHPEPYRTYVVDRNINYSNICRIRCQFCNFRRSPCDDDAYVLSSDQLYRKIEELLAIGGTQVLMQGGLHPDLPLEWYEQLLADLKQRFPQVHLHAFSPPEVADLSRRTNLPVAEVVARLHAAGLDSIPGGGAEILVDEVREALSIGKCGSDQWLEVMRQAHLLGMPTSATMMFGHIETFAQRMEHLQRIRDLQDQTGGFLAFILWPFQSGGTRLAGPDGAAAILNKPLRLAGAAEYLRMLSLARLFLDNMPNIQASWVTQGPAIGQLSLYYGANDMGSVMMEENVVSSAGTTFRMNTDQICRAIEQAGYQPRQRDGHYRIVA